MWWMRHLQKGLEFHSETQTLNSVAWSVVPDWGKNKENDFRDIRKRQKKMKVHITHLPKAASLETKWGYWGSSVSHRQKHSTTHKRGPVDRIADHLDRYNPSH